VRAVAFKYPKGGIKVKKKISKVQMWPVYQYGDHPKGTATIGEMAGALMHGNPATKVMRLNNGLRTSSANPPQPVAIVSGKVGGLSFIYSVADVVRWRKEHIAQQASKREQIMQRAEAKAEHAKRRQAAAKRASSDAKDARTRYRKYERMRDHADRINSREVI